MEVQAGNPITLSYVYNDGGTPIPLTDNTGCVLLLTSTAAGLQTLNTATVDDVPGGRVSCRVPGQLPGRYRWQFKVSMPGGEFLYSPDDAAFEFRALPNLDGA